MEVECHRAVLLVLDMSLYFLESVRQDRHVTQNIENYKQLIPPILKSLTSPFI